jgi:hypothetical protein
MLTQANILKAAIAGLIAALVMFVPMVYLVNVAGAAPFNIPPSAAFAQALGINFAAFVPPVLHFAYGLAAGIVYLLIFRQHLTLSNAGLLVGAMWLILMLFFAPVIGWGAFGFGDAQALPANDPMHLGPPVQFIVATLGFHVLFAVVLWAAARLLMGGPARFEARRQQEA